MKLLPPICSFRCDARNPRRYVIGWLLRDGSIQFKMYRSGTGVTRIRMSAWALGAVRKITESCLLGMLGKAKGVR